MGMRNPVRPTQLINTSFRLLGAHREALDKRAAKDGLKAAHWCRRLVLRELGYNDLDIARYTAGTVDMVEQAASAMGVTPHAFKQAAIAQALKQMDLIPGMPSTHQGPSIGLPGSGGRHRPKTSRKKAK